MRIKLGKWLDPTYDILVKLSCQAGGPVLE